MSRACPYCSQPLPEIRLGVKLPALKARIFDLVQRGGRDGIAGSDLFDIALADRGVERNTLKVHVCQINELIEDTGYQIVGRGTYRLLHRGNHHERS